MGPLNLPTGGLVYLDANGLIYSVERVEPYRTLLEPMWQAAQDGDITLVSSPILIVETLVKPLRDGNREIEEQYRTAAGHVRPRCACRARRARRGRSPALRWPSCSASPLGASNRIIVGRVSSHGDAPRAPMRRCSNLREASD